MEGNPFISTEVPLPTIPSFIAQWVISDMIPRPVREALPWRCLAGVFNVMKIPTHLLELCVDGVSKQSCHSQGGAP